MALLRGSRRGDRGGELRDGKLKNRVDVAQGLESAPYALARLFRGENQGKQLVRVADPAEA